MGERYNERTAKRLRYCREAAKETLEQIGKLVGVNKSTVMRWERGETSRINLPTMQRLAAHYGVNTAWLKGEDVPMQAPDATWLERHAQPVGELVNVPIIGTVRAGIGGAVLEEIVGYEAVQTAQLHDDAPLFWLRVVGDSMTPLINENDLVLVRKQDSVDSGSYAVVLVGGEEGLVKRVVYGDGWLELHSANPYYPPRRFTGDDVLNVRILGLVLESKRRFI